MFCFVVGKPHGWMTTQAFKQLAWAHWSYQTSTQMSTSAKCGS